VEYKSGISSGLYVVILQCKEFTTMSENNKNMASLRNPGIKHLLYILEINYQFNFRRIILRFQDLTELDKLMRHFASL
jgi:hypothetical protein